MSPEVVPLSATYGRPGWQATVARCVLTVQPLDTREVWDPRASIHRTVASAEALEDARQVAIAALDGIGRTL